jgi:hypothetical protein
MLETHIVMSSLIFHFILTLVLRPALLLVFCLISLIDLTITHMVLVHKRTTLCINALVTTHVLIVVIVSHVGLFSTGGSHTHPEPRHLDDSRFSHCGLCPTGPNGEVHRTVKTSSDHMVKC